MTKTFSMILSMILALTLLAGCGNAALSDTSLSTSQPTEKDSFIDTAAGVATTTAGQIQGVESNGIYHYLGVPYAQATERFVPAEAVKPWDGICSADAYGPISPQGAILGMGGGDVGEGTDNNCQNLNIWTPGIGDGEKRPVMVWLHGGGFSMGSANDDLYNGENLSRTGNVVVVGVNHRLNLFGHLDLSAYGEKYKDSANVGLTDIVAALQWVQDNIEQFGGDPDNVTVFGQSGGGAKVLSLMTTPYAQGLFHKGIVQSGATETIGVTFTTKEANAKLTERILSDLGITAETIEDIQTISAEALMEASAQALQDTAEEFQIPASLSDGYAMEWGPVIDGDHMPTDPVTEDSFAAAGKNIPLLIGSNLNEWTRFMGGPQENMTDDAVAAFTQAYPNADTSEAPYVDTFIRLPMLKIMSHKADQGGGSVYAYVLTIDNAYHGAEDPLCFS